MCTMAETDLPAARSHCDVSERVMKGCNSGMKVRIVKGRISNVTVHEHRDSTGLSPHVQSVKEMELRFDISIAVKI
jgi:hypothetical protein